MCFTPLKEMLRVAVIDYAGVKILIKSIARPRVAEPKSERTCDESTAWGCGNGQGINSYSQTAVEFKEPVDYGL